MEDLAIVPCREDCVGSIERCEHYLAGKECRGIDYGPAKPADNLTGFTHELKTWPEHFQPIIDRLKTAEVRHDDRGFREGDRLILAEWDPNVVGIAGPSRPGAFTGRSIGARVTHVLRDFGPLADGWVVLSFVLDGDEGAWIAARRAAR